MLEAPILISLDNLSKVDREIQIDLMRNWFYQNYEDPAHHTPFDSAEGGYVWVMGGPCDAREELESQFGDYVSEEVINELTEELEQESPEWVPVSEYDGYESYIVKDIQSIEDVHKEFTRSIEDVQALLAIELLGELKTRYNALLFANVIAALESYLSGKFIKLVLDDNELLQKLVETTPDFTREKFTLSEIFKVNDQLTKKVGGFLADILWHNLDRIKPMYKETLGVDFGDIGNIMQAVKTRHHIVHRNGRDKKGAPIKIEGSDIESLISEVNSLIDKIESQLEIPF